MRITRLALLALAAAGSCAGTAWGAEPDEMTPSALEQAKPHGYFQPGPRLGARQLEGAPLQEPLRCPPSSRRDGGDERATAAKAAPQRALPPGLSPAPLAAPASCLNAASTTDNPAAAPSPTK